MIKFTCSIFISSNNFFKCFFTYINFFKDSSAKYYQNKTERLQKKLAKRIKVFLKLKQKKSIIMVINDTKIYQNVKKKAC